MAVQKSFYNPLQETGFILCLHMRKSNPPLQAARHQITIPACWGAFDLRHSPNTRASIGFGSLPAKINYRSSSACFSDSRSAAKFFCMAASSPGASKFLQLDSKFLNS